MNLAIHVVAKFIALEYIGYIVDSGIGFLYRPASLSCRTGGDNPMPESTLSPQSGTINWLQLTDIKESG